MGERSALNCEIRSWRMELVGTEDDMRGLIVVDIGGLFVVLHVAHLHTPLFRSFLCVGRVSGAHLILMARQNFSQTRRNLNWAIGFIPVGDVVFV